MSSEHSDNPLFQKLVDPAGIHQAVPYGPWYKPVMEAWGLPPYLDGDWSTITEENYWVVREAARVNLLVEHNEQAGSVLWDIDGKIQEAKPDAISIWKWCPAPALSDPAKIRYTPTPEYGRADRQIITTPGKFLTKHYGDVLGGDQIRKLAEAWVRQLSVSELKFAETPDEVERVYVDGPDSCMSHDTDDYRSDEHPSRLWGYCKHTRVAYIEDGDGNIKGRCLVREDTEPKRYIRVYPSSCPALEGRLQAAGYVLKSSGLEGLRVPLIRQHRGILMPYVDGVGCGRVEGDFVVLGERGIDVQSQSGITDYGDDEDEDDGMTTCSGCGADVHDDDRIYSEYHDCDVCPSCEDSFVQAHIGARRTDLVRMDECVEYRGSWYLDDYDTLNAHDLVRDYNDDVVSRDEVLYVESQDNYYPHDMVVELEDETYALKEDCVNTPWNTYLDSSDAVTDVNEDYGLPEDLHIVDTEDGPLALHYREDGEDNTLQAQTFADEGKLMTIEAWLEEHKLVPVAELIAQLVDCPAAQHRVKELTKTEAQQSLPLAA